MNQISLIFCNSPQCGCNYICFDISIFSADKVYSELFSLLHNWSGNRIDTKIFTKESVKMRQWWVWSSKWKTEVAGCSAGDLAESLRFIKHFYDISRDKMHRLHILVGKHQKNSMAANKHATKIQCFVFI